MEPLIPSRETFLQRPRRVSRLYPVLALVAGIIATSFFYQWRFTQITSATSIAANEQRIVALEGQLDGFKAQKATDDRTIAEKTKQLDETTQQLSTTKSELDSATVQLNALKAQVKNQEDQLSANSAELQKLRTRPPLFNFKNETSQSDAALAIQQQEIKEVISNAYDVIKEVYGSPYLLNQVTISFVDNFKISGAAGEILIENSAKGISITIRLKSFSKNNFENVNTIIHETIHAFHGIAVLDSSAFEEGMAVAATDVVMRKLIEQGKLPNYSNLYLIISEAQYTNFNQTLVVHKDNEAFYTYPQVSKVYQLVGMAWMKLYKADPTIFYRLNEAYYAKVQKGEAPSDEMIRNLLIQLLPTVNGEPMTSFLTANAAFNPR